ncbi:hypothetical protein ACQ86N_02660 [Puia sp. P3]|uniref:hypothetical protein n=1 Tax=Puia sp. P3 TaxID=3423952 RepID=UPI003D667293
MTSIETAVEATNFPRTHTLASKNWNDRPASPICSGDSDILTQVYKKIILDMENSATTVVSIAVPEKKSSEILARFFQI